jgi:hypothetical protein
MNKTQSYIRVFERVANNYVGFWFYFFFYFRNFFRD